MAYRREPRDDQQRNSSSGENARLNRRLRGIWEREGKEYGSDADDEDELVDRFEATMKLSEQSIDRVMTDIRRSKSVDLCFLVDATGSMQPHIDGVRDSVAKVVNALVETQQSQSAGIEKLRFAVAAYRDLTDSIPFEKLDFTDRPEMCVDFCRHLVASGGGDAPEDVFGGLEMATKLQWAEGAGTRIIFHMADAPCHGSRYHVRDLADSHPGGDPKRRTESGLFDALKRLGIDYYFGKINDTTDRMIELFAAAYGRPITAFDVSSIASIAESVISSITTSVDFNVEQTKLGTAHMNVRKFQLEAAIPDWDQLVVQVGTYLQYKLPLSMEDVKNGIQLAEKEINSVRVKIADRPFAEGAERIAYYGLDLFQGYNVLENNRGRGGAAGSRVKPAASSSNTGRGHRSGSSSSSGFTEVVLKEYKFVGHKQNSLERYRTASEVQTVAFFLADKFNEQTAALGETMPIKFLKLRTLILRPEKSTLRVMSCEHRYYDGSGEFVKFTNNFGYSMRQMAKKVQQFGIDPSLLELVMAFSHWTYHYSKGFLMVVDLQGKICTTGAVVNKVLMTDPAIHCLDITRYAPLNLGKPGMQAFLAGHECGGLCKRLGLPARKLGQRQ